MNDKIYTLKKLAELLELKERTLRQKLIDKEIKGYKKWGQWYVLHSDLLRAIKGASMNVEPQEPGTPKKTIKRISTSEGTTDERTINKYSTLVEDIRTNQGKYKYDEYAKRNDVSLSIVKKVRGAMVRLGMI